MPSYFLALAVASLALAAVYPLLKGILPVRAGIYFSSVGLSLVLTAVLPRFLALSMFNVFIIYLLLDLFFTLALTLVWDKYFSPLPVAGQPASRVPATRELGPAGWSGAQLSPATGSSEDALWGLTKEEKDALLTQPFSPGEPVEEDTVPAALGYPGRDQHMTGLRRLFAALAVGPPPAEWAGLTVQLSEAYQNLGRYREAVEVVRTFLSNSPVPPEGSVLNRLLVTSARSEAIARVLQEDGQEVVPYAELTAEQKARAAKLACKLILRGPWQGEDDD